MDEKDIVVRTEGSLEKTSDDRQSSTEEKEGKGSLHAKSFDKISSPMSNFVFHHVSIIIAMKSVSYFRSEENFGRTIELDFRK